MNSYYPIIVFFASILIIVLAFFTTRLVSGGIKGNMSGRNIKFIEKLPLGVDKSLILIQLESHYYLMYLSKSGAQLIDKLDSLHIDDSMQSNISFSEIFKNFKSK
ncbi:flagellar biosynthetic protein FliO [Wukongibacter baidiensis]|uniref:flagellar biosynthetic protein FliO n=1 Tax=Wukongibacter baidiensis TaxID=1723361 RepID=UPI003D7F531C